MAISVGTLCQIVEAATRQVQGNGLAADGPVDIGPYTLIELAMLCHQPTATSLASYVRQKGDTFIEQRLHYLPLLECIQVEAMRRHQHEAAELFARVEYLLLNSPNGEASKAIANLCTRRDQTPTVEIVRPTFSVANEFHDDNSSLGRESERDAPMSQERDAAASSKFHWTSLFLGVALAFVAQRVISLIS